MNASLPKASWFAVVASVADCGAVGDGQWD